MPISTEPFFLDHKSSTFFRTVNRRGALRYIASDECGGLKALTQFAPPTNKLPRRYLRLLSWLNFRLPWAVESIGISEAFLSQAANRLNIPAEHVGIYVGEPDDRQKLVIIDVTGESPWVLKVAVGCEADAAIQSEWEGRERALGADCWDLGVPEMQKTEPVCERNSILVERIEGRQLTPDEFEEAFFGKGFKQQFSDFKSEGAVVGEWIDRNLMHNTSYPAPLVDACRSIGALDLHSPIGLVHGDFAPWNIIRRDVNAAERHLNNNQVKPKTHRQRLYAVDWEFSQAGVPLIFDYAYAVRCYEVLLDRKMHEMHPKLWSQLVALGELWFELRK